MSLTLDLDIKLPKSSRMHILNFEFYSYLPFLKHIQSCSSTSILTSDNLVLFKASTYVLISSISQTKQIMWLSPEAV